MALLEKSSRFSYAPLDILWMLSGHGKVLNSFYVSFIDIRFRTTSEMLIAKHVRFGEGMIKRNDLK